MSVPHKLFCGLPVDDLCLRDTTVSATNTSRFSHSYWNVQNVQEQATSVTLTCITYIFCWSCPLCLRLVILSARDVGHDLLVFSNTDEYCLDEEKRWGEIFFNLHLFHRGFWILMTDSFHMWNTGRWTNLWPHQLVKWKRVGITIVVSVCENPAITSALCLLQGFDIKVVLTFQRSLTCCLVLK